MSYAKASGKQSLGVTFAWPRAYAAEDSSQELLNSRINTDLELVIFSTEWILNSPELFFSYRHAEFLYSDFSITTIDHL